MTDKPFLPTPDEQETQFQSTEAPVLEGAPADRVVEIDGKEISYSQLVKMKSAEKRIELLAKILDKYGLDAIIGFFGFLGGTGDLVPAIASLYPVIEAVSNGLPKSVIAKMMLTVAADFGIGLVPLLGDFIDIFYKANKKNHARFVDYIEKVDSEFRAQHPDLLYEGERKGAVAITNARIRGVLEGGGETTAPTNPKLKLT